MKRISLRLLSTVVLSFALCTPVLAETTGKLKKILVLETNNLVERAAGPGPLKAGAQDPALRDYILARVKLQKLGDPQLFIQAMDWVASQWQHDGMNEAADSMSSLDILKKVHNEGQRYRCVEYGRVLADFLTAMGHVSRSIGMQSPDVAYGGWGRGHVATEVWSNELGKWIFLDPQFSIYASHGGEILNFHDMYLLKREGRFGEIKFQVTPQYATSNNQNAESAGLEYADFLKKYFGYLNFPAQPNGERVNVMLLLEGEQPPLTFQGIVGAGGLYTRDVGLAYPRLNATRIQLSFDSKPGPSAGELMKEHGIATEEAYIANMWRWAPEGNFKLALGADMPDLDHFEIRLDDGKWNSVTADAATWSLRDGINTLEARAVDKRGIKGPISYIKLRYQ